MLPSGVQGTAVPGSGDVRPQRALRGSPSPPHRWVRLALFIVVLLVHMTSPHAEITDSVRAIPVAQSITRRGTLSLDHFRETMPQPGNNVIEVDGHLYGNYPWAISLFAVPVLLAVDGAHALGVGPGVEGRIAAAGSDWEFQVVTMSLVVALTTVVIYQIGLESLRLGDRRRLQRYALAAAVTFSFGTAAWSTASRSYWQHGPSMLMLSLAALVAVRSRADPRVVRCLGPPLAASYFMRPTNSVSVALFTLWVLLRHRRYLVAHLAGMAVVVTGFVAVNVAAYGSVLQPYYGEERHFRSGGELVEALAGNLVSPSRGLFVFSPVLLLAVAGVVLKQRSRVLDDVDVLLAGCVVAHWLAISVLAFPAWWGGHSYGPRLFSDAVPFMVVLGLPVLDRLAQPDHPSVARRFAVAACLASAGVSMFVNFSGAYFRSSACWNAIPTGVDQDPSKVWDWSDPQFLRGPRNFLAGDQPRSEVTRGLPDC